MVVTVPISMQNLLQKIAIYHVDGTDQDNDNTQL
jgi:hypothetical protein